MEKRGQDIENCKQALAIARQTSDREEELVLLAKLAKAYRGQGAFERAIEYDEQALALSREIGHRKMEAASLLTLGLAHKHLGEAERVIECYEQALAIAQDIGDRRIEGMSLLTLGAILEKLGEVERATECFNEACIILEVTGDEQAAVAHISLKRLRESRDTIASQNNENMSVSSPDYAQALRKSSLPFKDELAKLVRPAIFLSTQSAPPGHLPVGVSRLGGLPDFPANMVWPSWQGKPQSFIAQINLSELPPFPDKSLLPESGLLFFFCDSAQSTYGHSASDRGSFAVLYSAHSGPTLQLGSIPKGLDLEAVFNPVRLYFRIGMTEPGWEHPILERLGLSFDERLAYAEVVKQAEVSAVGTEHSIHQMLGYPSAIQYAVAWDCERAQVGYWEADREKQEALEPTIREHVEEWELLLQVDWDPHARIDWIGDGRVYYMIRNQDLKTHRFDEAWFVLQST